MAPSNRCSSSPRGFAAAPASGRTEWHLLQILRLQIQSHVLPDRNGWQRGLTQAQRVWGTETGPQVFAALAEMLAQMSRARRSIFEFSNPDCASCASRMTAHESLLLQSLSLLRASAPTKARAVAFLLCESNPCGGFIAAAERLTQLLHCTETVRS